MLNISNLNKIKSIFNGKKKESKEEKRAEVNSLLGLPARPQAVNHYDPWFPHP